MSETPIRNVHIIVAMEQEVMPLVTRFRLRGRYWRWRMDTALGSDRTRWPSFGERRRAFIQFGAWARRIRKIGR